MLVSSVNGTAETGYLAAVRESYDTVAADYVRLARKPR
jgi:hypothetical protein